LGKDKKIFVCQDCGFSSVKWLGRCPECGGWDSLKEFSSSSKAQGNEFFVEQVLSLSEISTGYKDQRISTDMEEFDRVLGGGIVPGSMVLLGGEPGIGKSTLLLQVLSRLSKKGHKVLYASGEESANQIKLRAERLGADGGVLLLCQPEFEVISKEVKEIRPQVLAVDSIQTLYCKETNSLPGSMTQVKASAASVMQLAKGLEMAVFIIGHVTKEGSIAGPRALEHLVDTVLYFEGDRTQAFRILRTVKNRFGPTHEVGIFEMKDRGLSQVKNPSNLFMEHRNVLVAGSAIFPCIEGTRPFLVEIQALVNQSYLALPRRTTAGVDSNRLALLTAVLEKILGIELFDKDIFVNVAGGFKISEPAGDLPLISSIFSSYLDRPIANATAIFGEVGLTGEIRPVSNTEPRIKEAMRMGMKRCILPKGASINMKTGDFVTIPVAHVEQIPNLLFSS